MISLAGAVLYFHGRHKSTTMKCSPTSICMIMSFLGPLLMSPSSICLSRTAACQAHTFLRRQLWRSYRTMSQTIYHKARRTSSPTQFKVGDYKDGNIRMLTGIKADWTQLPVERYLTALSYIETRCHCRCSRSRVPLHSGPRMSGTQESTPCPLCGLDVYVGRSPPTEEVWCPKHVGQYPPSMATVAATSGSWHPVEATEIVDWDSFFLLAAAWVDSGHHCSADWRAFDPTDFCHLQRRSNHLICLIAFFGLNDWVVRFCFNLFTSNCGICYADWRALCPGPSSQEDRTLAARSKKKAQLTEGRSAK